MARGNNLFISQAGLQRAFNITITYNQNENTVTINTLPYLVTLYEKAITNETYIKFERGPFPDHFKSITDEMINKGDLIISKQPYHGDTTIHKYYLSKTPDLSLISTKELSVINDVIDKHADKSAAEFSDYSHGDMPWAIADDNDILDYEYVFYRDPEYSVRAYDD